LRIGDTNGPLRGGLLLTGLALVVLGVERRPPAGRTVAAALGTGAGSADAASMGGSG
jgi:hypothetical protein